MVSVKSTPAMERTGSRFRWSSSQTNIRFVLPLHILIVDLVDVIALHQAALLCRCVFDHPADLHIASVPILDIRTNPIIDPLAKCMTTVWHIYRSQSLT